MKSLTPDNFAKFRFLYPQYDAEIAELEKAVSTVEDPDLQNKIQARINVELGVVLLKNEEVDDLLKTLFQKELKSWNSVWL